MKRLIRIAGLCAVLGLYPATANASVIFTFTETGGTVMMTSAGTLDVSRLVLSGLPDGWGGTGTENNSTPGDIDIMGGTSFGGIDLQYGFHPGTNASAITNPGGPFTFSNFSVVNITGSHSFTTYSGFLGAFRQPGIGIVRADLVGTIWTPDQTWTYGPGATFASLGLNPGIYTVSDIETHEAITIQIGGAAVPEPTTLVLIATGVGLVAVRRRFVRA